MSHLKSIEEIRRKILQRKKNEAGASTSEAPSKVIQPTKNTTQPHAIGQSHLAVAPEKAKVFQNTRSHKKEQVPVDDSLLKKHHPHARKPSADISAQQKHYSSGHEKEQPPSDTGNKDAKVQLSKGIPPKLKSCNVSTRSKSSQHEQHQDVPAVQHTVDKTQSTPPQEQDSQTDRHNKKKHAQIEPPSTVATEKPTTYLNVEGELQHETSPVVKGFVQNDQPIQLKITEPEEESPQLDDDDFVGNGNPEQHVEMEAEQNNPIHIEKQDLHQQQQVESLRSEQQSESQQQPPASEDHPIQSSFEEEQQQQQAEQICALMNPIRKRQRLANKIDLKEQQKLRRAILNLRRVVDSAEQLLEGSIIEPPHHSESILDKIDRLRRLIAN